MAKLTKCRMCGQEIAVNAKICPHCGAKISKPIYKRWWFWLVIVFVGFWALGRSGTGNSNRGEASRESYTSANAGTIAPAESTKAVEIETVSYEITDTVFNYHVNSIGSTEYQGIVEITNTGTVDVYLRSCTFDLEDDDGHLLQTDSFISNCPDIIAPGEKGYFYNGIGSMLIDDGVSLDNGVNLKPTLKVEKSRGEIQEYELTDLSLRSGTFGPVVTGRVTNTTEKDDSLLYVQVIFYEADGAVLGIAGTNITDFTAGSQTSFEISSMGIPRDITLDMIADFKVITRPHYMQF